MPLAPYVSVKASVQGALGGEEALGMRIIDLDQDLPQIAARGITAAMEQGGRTTMELKKQELADLIGMEVSKFRPRYRQPRRAEQVHLLFRPGEESMCFLRLLVIHAYEARRWFLFGRSAEGIARPVLTEVIPELGARGLELARSEEGTDRAVQWILSRPQVRWPAGSLVTIPAAETASGREEHYPKQPQPWQQQNKERCERAMKPPTTVQLNG